MSAIKKAVRHDGPNTTQQKSLYRLHAELQNLFAYFANPLVSLEEKTIYGHLLVSTARKVAVLERGGA